MSDALKIGIILPETMGAYGDRGNAVVLEQRLVRRGFAAEIVTVNVDDDLPSGLDFYLLGGSEDPAQTIAVEELRRFALQDAVNKGAVVLAVCAGFQVLGEWYEDPYGKRMDGLGLIDAKTRLSKDRFVGELVVDPSIEGVSQVLTGFENHRGVTQIGEDVKPLGKVLHGFGNAADEDEGFVDGAAVGNMFATYMHGPMLARNPEFADHLIRLATGVDELAPLEEGTISALRDERLTASGITQK